MAGRAYLGPRFERYVGVDYSGAGSPTSRLPGLRVYLAERSAPPVEVRPPGESAQPGRRAGGHWSRRGVAEWLIDLLAAGPPTIVGIDHAFSFPVAYFEAHHLPREWSTFLEDFAAHWPTAEAGVRVEDVRRGRVGAGAARQGCSRWRRLADRRAGPAKSVFHFDCQGSVAKSTHAGLPWLLHLRQALGERLHIWPFDGWEVPGGRSVVAEVYPRLWAPGYPRQDRTPDQHDAWSVATWLREADLSGALAAYLQPPLSPADRALAEFEGWILGLG